MDILSSGNLLKVFMSNTPIWGWVVTADTEDTLVHVVPLSDDYPHRLHYDCPCIVWQDPEDDTVIHSAYDGRERYEQGRRVH